MHWLSFSSFQAETSSALSCPRERRLTKLHRTLQAPVQLSRQRRLHGGDLNEALTPHLYYAGKAELKIINKIKEVAAVLDVKYMVKSNSTTGVHSYGSISGIPSML